MTSMDPPRELPDEDGLSASLRLEDGQGLGGPDDDASVPDNSHHAGVSAAATEGKHYQCSVCGESFRREYHPLSPAIRGVTSITFRE